MSDVCPPSPRVHSATPGACTHSLRWVPGTGRPRSAPTKRVPACSRRSSAPRVCQGQITATTHCMAKPQWVPRRPTGYPTRGNWHVTRRSSVQARPRYQPTLITKAPAKQSGAFAFCRSHCANGLLTDRDAEPTGDRETREEPVSVVHVIDWVHEGISCSTTRAAVEFGMSHVCADCGRAGS